MKLVRDKIPEIIGEPEIEIIEDNEEYYESLKDKIVEEAYEFAESGKIEELADILEVIDAILKYKNVDISSLNKIKEEKAKRNGKFEKRIKLL